MLKMDTDVIKIYTVNDLTKKKVNEIKEIAKNNKITLGKLKKQELIDKIVENYKNSIKANSSKPNTVIVVDKPVVNKVVVNKPVVDKPVVDKTAVIPNKIESKYMVNNIYRPLAIPDKKKRISDEENEDIKKKLNNVNIKNKIKDDCDYFLYYNFFKFNATKTLLETEISRYYEVREDNKSYILKLSGQPMHGLAQVENQIYGFEHA
jgi:hypothetical protein